MVISAYGNCEYEIGYRSMIRQTSHINIVANSHIIDFQYLNFWIENEEKHEMNYAYAVDIHTNTTKP